MAYQPKPAHRKLSKIKVYKPGRPIAEIMHEYGIKHPIKLASNENSLGPAPKVIEALKKGASEVFRYPDANAFELKSALAKKHGVRLDQLVFGNGSDELIVMAIRAFVSASEMTMTAKPTFLIYKIASDVQGVGCQEIKMADFRYNLDAMLNKIHSKTKLIFIANPDNPIGSYLSHKEIDGFLKKVPKRVLVFLDEAYYEYASQIKDYPNSLKLLKKYPNLIISRTFSKAYALSSLRIGYAISSKPVIEVLNQVREPFNLNGMAQIAALSALKSQKYYSESIRIQNGEKDGLIEEFTRMGIKTLPSATNFILIEAGDAAIEIYNQLLRRGVIIREMSSWGLKKYLRITIGKPGGE